MIDNDNLRYTKMALNNGSGAIPRPRLRHADSRPRGHQSPRPRRRWRRGFRQFDASERYRNEKEVGEAMQEVFKAGKIKREEVFVATKVWNNNHRPERGQARL